MEKRKLKESPSMTTLKNSKPLKIILSICVILLTAVYLSIFSMSWYEGSITEVFTGTNGLVRFFCFLLLIGILLYATVAFMYFFSKDIIKDVKNIVLLMVMIALIFTLCIILADYVNIYVMPFALAAIIVGVIINVRAALVFNILISQMLFMTIALFSPMAAFSMASLSASIFANLILGFVMIFLIDKNLSRIKFNIYALSGSVVAVPIVVLVTFINNGTNHDILMNMLWIFVSNLISIVLFMALLPIFESIFNAVTSYRLDELSSPNNKLLKKLKEEAPGTYNHSIMVSNIAESCAYAIGENTKLARACALYHDVGKLVSPEYFIENQEGGYNPHDDLIPEVSVKMITDHTTNGYKIAKEYHLPEEIALVALEHHGTIPVKYFYNKAQNIATNQVNAELFAYKGPKPSTKVSAIIMIADTVEAATRAMNFETYDEYDKFVFNLIKEKIELGQFDDCPITMQELYTIKDTIVKDIPSMYHSRIKYPDVKKR